jgi:hypothetical protein
MMTKRKTDRNVSTPYGRIQTPKLTEEQRQKIRTYHEGLKREGMIISEGAAVLHAAMQWIRSQQEAQ